MTESRTSQQKPSGRRRWSLLPLVLLLLVGIALRVPLLPFRGTSDHQIWKIWAYAGATHPYPDIYRLQGDEKPPIIPAYVKRVLIGKTRPARWLYGDRAEYVDYPPLTPLLFSILGRAYAAYSPTFEDTPLLNAAVKLPGLLAELATACLIYVAARRRFGARFGLLASALLWLNPMAVLAGALLGYLDAVYAGLLIAAVLLLASSRHAWGWVLYALALMAKPQPLVAAPVLLIVSAARRSASKLMGYVASAGAAVLIFLVPFLLGSTLINMLANLRQNATERYLSANNANLWWLAGYFKDVHDFTARGVDPWQATNVTTQIAMIPDLIAQGLPDPRPWALGLFILFTLVVVGGWWKAYGSTPQAKEGYSPAMGEAVALQIYGATVLLTQVHENHAYGAVAVLAVAWWTQGRDVKFSRELLGIFIALSGIVCANLLLFYGLGEDLGSKIIRRDVVWFDLSVVLSVVNMGVFGWWLVRWLRNTRLLPAFSRRRTGATERYSEEARLA